MDKHAETFQPMVPTSVVISLQLHLYSHNTHAHLLEEIVGGLVFTMHYVSLSWSESLESSVSKELSDSVPLGSWLYGAGPLSEHLSDELPEHDRSFISPLRHSLL